jgi:hypothetical protein
MSSTKQDQEFASEMSKHIEFSNSALEDACEWIGHNMEPYEVFSDEKLIDWASGEEPETIFDKEQLSDWAEKNGFVKE